MAPEIARPPLAEQPWFAEFLADRGFQRSAPGAFTNGRATVRVDGSVLYAIPGDGSKQWRSELREAPPGAIRQLLTVVLAAPSFLSQSELDQRAARQRTAEEALKNIATSIRESPDTHSGQHLRRFVWSIWNGHHALNLWRMKDVLDSNNRTAVREVFTAWFDGYLGEESIREALLASGEMERWDTVRLRAPEQRRVADALDAVTDLINATPPGAPSRELTRANGLLRQVLDLLQDAKK
jgi:hypothetical protein